MNSFSKFEELGDMLSQPKILDNISDIDSRTLAQELYAKLSPKLRPKEYKFYPLGDINMIWDPHFEVSCVCCETHDGSHYYQIKYNDARDEDSDGYIPDENIFNLDQIDNLVSVIKKFALERKKD